MTNENDFTTHAGQTLHPKSTDHDDLQIIDAAIKRMMELNGDQRNRHFSMVDKMLDAAATGNPQNAHRRLRRCASLFL